MAILKIVRNDYTSNNTNFPDGIDETVLNYIFDEDKAKNGFGCVVNALAGMPTQVAEQFQIVRRIFHKENGRLIRHFILAFEKNEITFAVDAFVFACRVADYYKGRYQIAIAVHEDTDNVHVHFVMNTVSFVDGKKFSEGPQELFDFIKYINCICPPICFGVEQGTKSFQYLDY